MSQLEASRDRVQATATALTIGGSDPSGGAGLQADLKTFQQLGVYGMSVVTLLTVQNTQGVQRVELMSTDIVREQWNFVTSDIVPNAIKVGALEAPRWFVWSRIAWPRLLYHRRGSGHRQQNMGIS